MNFCKMYKLEKKEKVANSLSNYLPECNHNGKMMYPC